MSINPRNDKLAPMQWCAFCGGMHENLGATCQNHECQQCFRLCMRLPNCTWKDETIDYNKQAIADAELNKKLNAPTVAQIVETAALHNIKDAFMCWLASTTLDIKATEPDILWSELEKFVSEVLTPCDAGKQYLLIKKDEGGNPSIDFLDATKLFINQDKEYVLVEGKTRKRIGRNVAVMG